MGRSSFVPTAMLAHALLALQLALLEAANVKIDVFLWKCCGEFEMLSGDGKECVDTDWPRNVSNRHKYGSIFPPIDDDWMSRWLAPGLQPKDIGLVELAESRVFDFSYVISVNASGRWNPEWRSDEELPESQITFSVSGWMVVKSHTVGGIQATRQYCVDAALPPLGPFALLTNRDCGLENCVMKCCDVKGVLVNEGSVWKCQRDSRGYWSPRNSSFAKHFDRDTLFTHWGNDWCPSSFRMVNPEDRMSYKFQEFGHEFLFSFWTFCFDNLHYGDGVLDEGVFYCEFPEITVGIFKLLCPLCFVSTLLLAVALVSIACNSSMRLKTHGLCLGCHAACLFAFNVGQITYYMTNDMLVDNMGLVLAHRLVICENFAIFMYFLQIAGWSWLTCVCINMTLGFRRFQVAGRGGGKVLKKFLALSSFGWGLPLLMTIVTASTFKRGYYSYGRGLLPVMDSTYTPTLQETRVCFNEYSVEM